MVRAIIGYALAVPMAMLMFWLVGSVFYPPTTPAPLMSLLFGAAYFAPLMLLFSLPGLAVLVTWALLFRSRSRLVASALSAAVVLAVFAYSSNVMCRVLFFGSDCWGNIGFQLTEKSPFAAEYGMVFWASVLCSLVFWLLLARRPGSTSDLPPTVPAASDA